MEHILYVEDSNDGMPYIFANTKHLSNIIVQCMSEWEDTWYIEHFQDRRFNGGRTCILEVELEKVIDFIDSVGCIDYSVRRVPMSKIRAVSSNCQEI